MCLLVYFHCYSGIYLSAMCTNKLHQNPWGGRYSVPKFYYIIDPEYNTIISTFVVFLPGQ